MSSRLFLKCTFCTGAPAPRARGSTPTLHHSLLQTLRSKTNWRRHSSRATPVCVLSTLQTCQLVPKIVSFINPMTYRSPRSADCQVCCVADLPVGHARACATGRSGFTQPCAKCGVLSHAGITASASCACRLSAPLASEQSRVAFAAGALGPQKAAPVPERRCRPLSSGRWED
jgi:hypothetical protein